MTTHALIDQGMRCEHLITRLWSARREAGNRSAIRNAVIALRAVHKSI